MTKTDHEPKRRLRPSGRRQAGQSSAGAGGSPEGWRGSSGPGSGAPHHEPKRRLRPSGRRQAGQSSAGAEGSPRRFSSPERLRDTRSGRAAMLRILLLAVFCLLFSVNVNKSVADQANQVLMVDPVARDGKLYLDADIQIDVQGDLRNVAQKGIPIYFTADAEIISRRWWWTNKTVAREQLTWRILYNALTRQWRVSTGDLSLPEASLDDALARVRHIRGWAVADLDNLTHDETYHGRIRVRLDTSLLARPFQVDALNSSAWSLATPWKNFSFSISVDVPQH